MANGKWTDTIEYDKGKFRFRIKYSETASSFTWSWECDVIKAPESKRYLWVRWGENGGGWSDWKHTDATTKDYVSKINRTISRPTLKVQFGVGQDHAKTVSAEVIEATTKAITPTSIEASKANDARYSIKVGGYGTAKTPTVTLVLERAVDTQTSWSGLDERTLNATDSYTETFVDDTTEAGHKYWWRVKASSTGGDSGYITCSAEYTSPETSVDIDVQEGSGYNTVVWSVDSVSDIDRGIIEGWYVTRSTNGGAFETIGTVQANPNQYNYEYVDSNISSGNTYKYAVQSFGQGGQSHESQEGGSEITTAPSRPISVNAYRNADDYVVVEITDAQNTADTVLIERSIDGHDFVQIASESYPLDRYVDTTAVGSDSIKYRVRNQNSKGYSDYTESNSVLLKSPPNPPSLLSPYNNSVQSVDDQPIRLVWQHNATDGSPQTKADVRVKVNGTEAAYTVDTESYIELENLDANDIVEWYVRTKGSHANYSNFSTHYTFNVLKKPEITILEPENSQVISMPIVLKWLYNDISGELKELRITLIKNNSEIQSYLANPTQTEYSLAGFLFENETVYGIRVDALSTTGLKASQTISVTIKYEPVSLEGGLLPTVVTDEETGFAYITIGRDITENDEGIVPEPIPIREAYLYRLHDKQRTLLGAVNDGSQIIDKYAPLNVEYQYEFLMLTESGEVSLVSVTVDLPSVFSFIYFGDSMFKGKWNPKINNSLDRPERTLKRYSGREYELTYDSKAMSETSSYSCVLVDRNDLVELKDLMRSGHGRGIWKSVDGDSFDAVFKMSYDTDKYYKNQHWTVSLDITRIEV